MQGDLAEYFVESWTYTACMDIVQRCDEWSRVDRPNGDYSGLIAYESARSELLDIARVQVSRFTVDFPDVQVERIGVACGHLPNEYPFSPPSTHSQSSDDVLFESSDAGLSDTTPSSPSSLRPLISSLPILEAISNPQSLHNLYLNLTQKTIAAYEACGKTNSIIRLRADLAGLALYTEDWSAGWDLCRGLARDCAELGVWEPVAKFSLDGALMAHERLGVERDEEWLHIALAYLRVRAVMRQDDDEEDGDRLDLAVEGIRHAKIDQSGTLRGPALEIK
jgi:hypothetical protein